MACQVRYEGALGTVRGTLCSTRVRWVVRHEGTLGTVREYAVWYEGTLGTVRGYAVW